MPKIISKSSLAIVLSGLKGFESPKVRQEQYATDSEVAATVLWNAHLLGDIEQKVIADLGCGTGILGIGTLLLGAKKVYFVDSDENALETARTNISKILTDFRDARQSKIFDILKVKSESYEFGKAEFIWQDIRLVKLKAEVIIQNPPFGTKVKHNDIIFLKKAMEIGDVVYSFHKSESKVFLERFAAKRNAKITHIWGFKFPLKASYEFHRRQILRIDVSCFRFEK